VAWLAVRSRLICFSMVIVWFLSNFWTLARIIFQAKSNL